MVLSIGVRVPGRRGALTAEIALHDGLAHGLSRLYIVNSSKTACGLCGLSLIALSQVVLELAGVLIELALQAVATVSSASSSAWMHRCICLGKRDSRHSVLLMARGHLRFHRSLPLSVSRNLCCLLDCLDDRVSQSVAHDQRHIQVCDVRDGPFVCLHLGCVPRSPGVLHPLVLATRVDTLRSKLALPVRLLYKTTSSFGVDAISSRQSCRRQPGPQLSRVPWCTAFLPCQYVAALLLLCLSLICCRSLDHNDGHIVLVL